MNQLFTYIFLTVVIIGVSSAGFSDPSKLDPVKIFFQITGMTSAHVQNGDSFDDLTRHEKSLELRSRQREIAERIEDQVRRAKETSDLQRERQRQINDQIESQQARLREKLMDRRFK